MKKNLQPKQLLLLLSIFGILSVLVTKNIFVKEYNVEVNAQQSFENLTPQKKTASVKASTSNNVCGEPVVVYTDGENCSGGGSTTMDVSSNAGGTNRGSVIYSDDLQLVISKITIPTNLLSGSDIPNTNLILRNDDYVLPAASSMLTEHHAEVGRAPGESVDTGVVYDTWASKGSTKFAELDENSNEVEVVVDEYVPSNTQACATCSTNPDRSNTIGETVLARQSIPGHTTTEEDEGQIILMCKDENSIKVDANGLTCIDEEYSVLKKVTAMFSVDDWYECSRIEYDEEGNQITDGKCINTEDIVLDLSSIFGNTNEAYARGVANNTYPGSDYNGELSIIFPAWVEIKGEGIFKVSAKITVPYEYYRQMNAFDDTESETPSRNQYNAFIKYVEGLDRPITSF